MAAPKKGRRSTGAQGKPGRALLLILLAMVALVGGMFLSGHTKPRLGIDLAGGTSITLEAKSQPGKKDAINQTNMNTAVGIIERRVNGLGVQEAEVQTQGDKHIIVNIPKGSNEKQAREQVGTTAELNFRPVLTYAQAENPEPEPSPSSSGGSGKPGDKPSDKPSGTPDDKTGAESGDASGDEKATAGSSDGATTQGRAVTEGLRPAAATDDESPKPSGSGKQSESPKAPDPTPSAPAPEGVPASLQKQFEKLDCTTKEGKADAGRIAAEADNGDPTVGCDSEQPVKYVLGPVAVEGKNVSDANAALDQTRGQGWIVQMSFDGKGSDAFGKVTGELAKKQPPQNQFAIVLDGEVVSAPSVNERLVGDAEISGKFTQQTAEDLANILSYGALPLTFQESDVTTVTAALGGEQLNAGLIAGAIGLAVVILYLIAYYRGLSLIAIVSLLFSAVLTYTIMSLLGPTIGFALNLPAVCGAIVAIGITADSFIVYFERIRDEIREGRTLRPAVERGWPRARRTILVSDFVSFLAAAVLFIVSVGKVKGFAFTLGLTTLLDVVVVFLFTKPLMTILARKKFFASGHPWSGLDPVRLGAKPPLRRDRRTSTRSTDHPKEA
ncbi:protein translocase subunit SecD [Streptomyces sp. NPDC054784]